MAKKRLLLVIVACIAAWCVVLPMRGVWAPDEARYAEVTREMASSGQWIIPELNGELYTQKPPLFFDLARLVSLPFGRVPEWAVKVPSLVAAAVTLLLVGLIGARLAGREAAWLAPLLLGSMFKFSWQAQFGQIDMVLTALVIAQIYVGLRLSSGQGSRWLGIVLMSLLGTAGVLAKGPVGCLLPWLVLAAYLAAGRDWRALKRLGFHWIVPALLILCGAWLLYAGFAEGWSYPKSLLFRQSVQRYFNPWHHKAPFYYFLGIFFTDGLPFSLLLIPMAAPLARKKTWKEPAALLPLVWMAVYLVFFSLSPAKRSVYILPLFPAMALLLAYGLLKVQTGRWPSKAPGWILAALAVLFVIVGFVSIDRVPPGYDALAWWLVGGTALLAAGCLAAWRLTKGGSVVSGVTVLAVASLVFFVFTGGAVVQTLDPVKAPRELGNVLKEKLRRGAQIAVYPSLVPSVNYYAEATTRVFRLSERRAAVDYLEENPRRLLLAREADWKMKNNPQLQTLGSYRIGKSKYFLFSKPLLTVR